MATHVAKKYAWYETLETSPCSKEVAGTEPDDCSCGLYIYRLALLLYFWCNIQKLLIRPLDTENFSRNIVFKPAITKYFDVVKIEAYL